MGVGARTGEAGCGPGESTGYGRRLVAEQPTWIGIVPVGYADGFRRDLTGTEVLRRRASGGVSWGPSRWMRSPSSSTGELPVGTPVTLLGDGITAEEHARVAGTIGYELVTSIGGLARRGRRVIVGA